MPSSIFNNCSIDFAYAVHTRKVNDRLLLPIVQTSTFGKNSIRYQSGYLFIESDCSSMPRIYASYTQCWSLKEFSQKTFYEDLQSRNDNYARIIMNLVYFVYLIV